MGKKIVRKNFVRKKFVGKEWGEWQGGWCWGVCGGDRSVQWIRELVGFACDNKVMKLRRTPRLCLPNGRDI